MQGPHGAAGKKGRDKGTKVDLEDRHGVRPSITPSAFRRPARAHGGPPRAARTGRGPRRRNSGTASCSSRFQRKGFPALEVARSMGTEQDRVPRASQPLSPKIVRRLFEESPPDAFRGLQRVLANAQVEGLLSTRRSEPLNLGAEIEKLLPEQQDSGGDAAKAASSSRREDVGLWARP